MVGRWRRKFGELNHNNAGIHDVTSGKLLIFFLPFPPGGPSGVEIQLGAEDPSLPRFAPALLEC